MAEKWLLTGGTGQVGLALRRRPPPGVEIVAPARSEFDLARLPPLEPWLEGVTAVVNCGGYTAVDRAESEAGSAAAVNAEAPGRLGKAAAQRGIPLVHVSTDYVFGAGDPPWREDSPSGAPLNVYGRTKAAGERAVQESGARFAIVRTSWVVSADGNNFLKTMLRLGAEREIVRIVNDQRGSPTHAADLALALAAITSRFTADPQCQSGFWHCANTGETTWHDLAQHIFATASRHGMRVPKAIQAITTAEYPTPAYRPADSRLDCGKLAKDFGIRLRPWQEAIDAIVAELATQGQHA